MQTLEIRVEQKRNRMKILRNLVNRANFGKSKQTKKAPNFKPRKITSEIKTLLASLTMLNGNIWGDLVLQFMQSWLRKRFCVISDEEL